jgi:cell division protein FtsB
VSSPRALVERILPVAILALAVVSVPVLVLSEAGLPRLNKLRQERERIGDKVSQLSLEIRQLRAQAELIKSDPGRLEQVARDELGLVRRTEVVFQFER